MPGKFCIADEMTQTGLPIRLEIWACKYQQLINFPDGDQLKVFWCWDIPEKQS